MEKKRRPQRKKSKHQVVRFVGSVYLNDTGWKEIPEMYKLGDHFGFFRINEKIDEWSVTYLPTGQCVLRVIGRKEAEALVKRLYVRVKTFWEPTKEEFHRWVQWMEEMAAVTSKYQQDRGKEPVTAVTKTHNIAPEDFEDDIPF